MNRAYRYHWPEKAHAILCDWQAVPTPCGATLRSPTQTIFRVRSTACARRLTRSGLILRRVSWKNRLPRQTGFINLWNLEDQNDWWRSWDGFRVTNVCAGIE